MRMTMRSACGRLALVCLLGAASYTSAEPGHSRGSFTLAVQTQSADEFYLQDGSILDLGELDTHSVFFGVSYNLNEHWTIHAGIPYIRSRYSGYLAHDPALIDDPSVAEEAAEAEFLDDGEYHGAFQDFKFGVSYHTRFRGLNLTPFVEVEIPSHGYETFALAAVGLHQKRLELGVETGKVIDFSRFYWRAMLSHTWVEPVENVNTDHWRYELELGYFFSPRLAGRVYYSGKKGNGLDAPEDYPSFTDRRWFYHDQTMRHEYTNVGVGLDYSLNPEYTVSMWTVSMIDGSSINRPDYSLHLELTKSF